MKIKSLFSTLAATGVALTLSGCSLYFNKPTEPISLTSQPSGAEVSVNGKVVGKTPITVEYDRLKAPVVVLKAPGYAPTQLQIKRGVQPLAILDGVFFIPFAVDCAKLGCVMRYGQADVNVALLAPGAKQYSENCVLVKPYDFEKLPKLDKKKFESAK